MTTNDNTEPVSPEHLAAMTEAGHRMIANVFGFAGVTPEQSMSILQTFMARTVVVQFAAMHESQFQALSHIDVLASEMKAEVRRQWDSIAGRFQQADPETRQ